MRTPTRTMSPRRGYSLPRRYVALQERQLIPAAAGAWLHPVGEAPLPLVPRCPTKAELELRKRSKFRLYVNPEADDNNTFERYVYHIDGHEEPRAILQWWKDLEMLRTGMAIQTPGTMIATTKGVCEGAALHYYEAELALIQEGRMGEEDEEPDFESHFAAVRNVLRSTLPYDILRKQRRYMRRSMKKPLGMRIKEYVGHLIKINKDELPLLPPFGVNQSLPTDEFVDIIHRNLPVNWQAEMTRQNFVPENRTLLQLIEVCERIEEAEATTEQRPFKRQRVAYEEPPRPTPQPLPPARESLPNTSSSRYQGPTLRKYCTYHRSTSHNTSECRQQRFHGTNNQDRRPDLPNKAAMGLAVAPVDWKKKAEETRATARKEMAAVMKKFQRRHDQREPSLKRVKELSCIDMEVDRFLAREEKAHSAEMFAIDLTGDDSDKENQEPTSMPATTMAAPAASVATNQASTGNRPTAAEKNKAVPNEIMAPAQTLTGIKRAFPEYQQEAEEQDDLLDAPDSDEFDFM
jgi:hypothetical protein